MYAEGDWEFIKFNNERNILRIRRQNNASILTLKRPGVVDLHSIEHETTVDNPEEVHEMLQLMGYLPIVHVVKDRQKGVHDGMEICLDEVERLGTFIEVERLLETSTDPSKVQDELFDFLETLGVSRDAQETRGYDTLIRLLDEGKLEVC